ncbi:MAG: hypothetical protein IJP44_06435 [Bacteroidales bacterium]|nr:hypothetical protein [Bacteroidales bacterium]
MKKLAIFVAAFVLTLGLAQCKKEQPNAQTPEGEKVHISVKVGNNGSRADVDPSTGHITFKDGDILYVGYNGAKVGGELTYSTSASSFSGDLTIAQDGDDKPLYFYYMGGLTATEVDATHYTVDISDQTSNYPVISSGTSTANYTGAGAYTTTLLNYCALVKFATNVISGTVSVGGMNTVATVNFGTNEITPGTIGTVSFATDGSGEGWTILLEQNAVDDAAVTATGYEDGTCDVPAITNNMFYTTGVSISLTATPSVPTGAINGQFTINSSGDKVWFSQGNLQATTTDNGSSWSWAFATNQYDKIGNATANTRINGNGTVSDNGTVDLFGWSTSATYFGIHSNTGLDDYSGDFVDWGTNAISNGGNTANQWRTLTQDEWNYLFNTRTASTVNGTSDARFAKAYLFENIHGIILFPDNYTHPSDVTAPTGINATDNTSYDNNQYTAEQWAKMEAAGAVFLPAAGSRYGGSTFMSSAHGYWSSTASGDLGRAAYYLYFNQNNLSVSDMSRYYGYSVRLVHDVN